MNENDILNGLLAGLTGTTTINQLVGLLSQPKNVDAILTHLFGADRAEQLMSELAAGHPEPTWDEYDELRQRAAEEPLYERKPVYEEPEPVESLPEEVTDETAYRLYESFVIDTIREIYTDGASVGIMGAPWLPALWEDLASELNNALIKCRSLDQISRLAQICGEIEGAIAGYVPQAQFEAWFTAIGEVF